MLYIDGISLKYLKDEFEESLAGRKVTRIFQYDKLSLSLFFGKINLFFSINPQLPICYIRDKKDDAPEKPMAFSLSLRKTLLGSILHQVKQHSSDRILQFTFYKIDELGVRKEYHLILELMGKHSNIILIDNEKKILDLIKKFSLEENRLRLLMPNVPYELPEIYEKYNAYELRENDYEKVRFSIEKGVEGIGSHNKKRMDTYENYMKVINMEAEPCAYMDGDIIKFASFTPFDNFDSYKKKIFSSCNELTEWYIEYTASSNKINTIKKNLTKALKRKIKKDIGTIKKLEEEIMDEDKYNSYKEAADILAANMYKLKNGMKAVEVYDFYNDRNIILELDEKLSPNENLDAYYKKYNKGKRAIDFAIKRKVEISENLKYLNSLETYLDNAKTLDVLESLQEEFAQEGIVKKSNDKKNRKNKEISVGIEEMPGGEVIFYGRNNKENEYITFKIADKNDIWLHIKDLPGSHVIIKGADIDTVEDEVLFRAGELARAYSKVEEDNAVQVDYCLRKFVKKPKGSKSGYVIYSNEKALLIDPD
jgi:predicted ribosome quality control (RQC) complex YloA/Tae2 family protein